MAVITQSNITVILTGLTLQKNIQELVFCNIKFGRGH